LAKEIERLIDDSLRNKVVHYLTAPDLARTKKKLVMRLDSRLPYSLGFICQLLPGRCIESEQMPLLSPEDLDRTLAHLLHGFVVFDLELLFYAVIAGFGLGLLLHF